MQIGEPVSEPSREIVEIKVLGPGSSRCERLTEEVMAVLSETGIMADLEHVRGVAEIGRFGVVGSPALIINDEVKATGAVPSDSNSKPGLNRRIELQKHSVQDLRVLVDGLPQ